ncbi:MAG: hypothetical protein WA885_12550 [Phormidesmis sp.]
MNNDWVRLTILLSVLLLMIFPFAGLAPLMLLFFAVVVGWAFQLASTIIGATESPDAD